MAVWLPFLKHQTSADPIPIAPSHRQAHLPSTLESDAELAAALAGTAGTADGEAFQVRRIEFLGQEARGLERPWSIWVLWEIPWIYVKLQELSKQSTCFYHSIFNSLVNFHTATILPIWDKRSQSLPNSTLRWWTCVCILKGYASECFWQMQSERRYCLVIEWCCKM